MTPIEVVERLEELPEMQLQVVGLALDLLRRGGDAPNFTARMEEIEVWRSQLSEHLQAMRELARRCETLPPQPSRKPPSGF